MASKEAAVDVTILALAVTGARPRRRVGRTTLANIAAHTNVASNTPKSKRKTDIFNNELDVYRPYRLCEEVMEILFVPQNELEDDE